MAMTPFATSLLGLDSNDVLDRRRQRNETAGDETLRPIVSLRDIAPQAFEQRAPRRVTSHYNQFQTQCSPLSDPPPPYSTATARRPVSRRYFDGGNEVLPKYTCTVKMEGSLLLQLEAVNPLHGLKEQEWREVYVILRGTQLTIHKGKNGDGGKVLKTYTLQHAEVGLATDEQYTVLVPQSRLAHLIPSPARRKAWQKDPQLFRPVKQHILRLRAETDQILLGHSSEDRLHGWIHAISAGIDIAPAIDERSIPRQCTVPRRRRRQRPRPTGDVTDRRLIEEQEQILRDLYPAFAQGSESATNGNRPATSTSGHNEATEEGTQSADQDAEDLDLSAMAEESASSNSSDRVSTPTTSSDSSGSGRPAVSRMTTASSLASTFSSSEMLYATNPANFAINGKWAPPHPRTAAQQLRYMRRCLPVLLIDAPRASDVLICEGKRVCINWRMDVMEAWTLQPPSYKSHDFRSQTQLTRTVSQRSAAILSSPATPTSSESVIDTQDGIDEVTPVESSLAGLELTKVQSAVPEKGQEIESAARAQLPAHPGSKVEEAHGVQVHGVLFGF